MYNNYIGPINYILVDVLASYDLRPNPSGSATPKLIFFSIAGMEWWWGLGYHTMFFLAGLATIPKDLSDAARVDGAGEWRMFWGDHHLATPPDHPGPDGRSLRERDGSHRRVHHHGWV